MAKAQSKYPVKICHYLWMCNHYHMILSGSPALISPFMNYIDGEIAKSLKRLLPYFQSRVWRSRFKEQRICTANDAIRMISYLYNNPVRAGLVDSVCKWSGVSSWKAFITDNKCILAKWIRPSCIRRIWARLGNKDEIKILSQLLLEKSDYYELGISPYAWVNCFAESASMDRAAIRERILNKVKEDEKFNRTLHNEFNGEKILESLCYFKEYKSGSNSRTPFLICGDSKIRGKLIIDYRSFVLACQDAYKQKLEKLRRIGKNMIVFPKGCYPPQIRIISSGFIL